METKIIEKSTKLTSTALASIDKGKHAYDSITYYRPIHLNSIHVVFNTKAFKITVSFEIGLNVHYQISRLGFLPT